MLISKNALKKEPCRNWHNHVKYLPSYSLRALESVISPMKEKKRREEGRKREEGKERKKWKIKKKGRKEGGR